MVGEIINAGGRAAADYHGVLDGSAMVEHAVHRFGRLDILVNNASISRDVNFENMTDQDWDGIDAVHVKGKTLNSFPRSSVQQGPSISAIPSISNLLLFKKRKLSNVAYSLTKRAARHLQSHPGSLESLSQTEIWAHHYDLVSRRSLW